MRDNCAAVPGTAERFPIPSGYACSAPWTSSKSFASAPWLWFRTSAKARSPTPYACYTRPGSTSPVREACGVPPAGRHRGPGRGLRVPFHTDGVISQFQGYEYLTELDWARSRARYTDIGQFDLILQAEGDCLNNDRVAKQVDVLMLFYLLSVEELRGVLDRLGYPVPTQAVRDTVAF